METSRYAKLAEDCRFNLALFGDSQELWRDMYVTMTASALATSRIGLVAAVTNPLTRHPTVTANAIGSVNEVSNGRAILGLGRGGSALRNLGLKPVPVKEFEEALIIIKNCLARNPIEIRGLEYKIKWPITSVPIYVAAEGPKMLNLAGRLADGVMISNIANIDLVSNLVSQVDTGARQAGRNTADVKKLSYICCSLSDNREKAYRLIKPYILGLLVENPFYASLAGVTSEMDRYKTSYSKIGDPKHTDEWMKAVEICSFVPDELVDMFAAAGTIEEIKAKVNSLETIGASAVILRPFYSFPIMKDKEFQLDYMIKTVGSEILGS